jgi:dTDP-4-amino-4,6-dideoxygalactose transaminase
MLVTNDSALADKLRVLRTHGSRSRYEYELIGMNSRLDALQAAILRVKLRHLDAWAKRRQQMAADYTARFKNRGLDSVMALPEVAPKCTHVFNQFVMRAPRRDQLIAHLRERGVPTEIYYPLPLHLQRAFAYLGYKAGDLPRAEAASREVLAIPIYPEMSVDQRALVVDSIASFYRG